VIPALDDNPDANAGSTAFSSPDLGNGWACSGLFGGFFPVGDRNPSSGPGKGDAFVTCDHYTGGTYHLAGESLPLDLITFEAVNVGVDNLAFGDLTRLAWQSTTIAICDPDSARAMPCDGATISIVPVPTATATPSPTRSPTPTLSPTPTRSPTPTPQRQPDSDDGGAPDFLELAVLGDPSNPADDAAILAADNDGDGCGNSEELGGAAAAAPGSTGAYDPLAWYDFYDVPVPAYPDMTPNGPKNQAVALADVLAVLKHVGTLDGDGGVPNTNGVAYDSVKDSCDWNADANPDEEGLCYDRTTPSSAPNPPWEVGPPSGAVTLSDVLGALKQVGLDCSGTPYGPKRLCELSRGGRGGRP
jgi:hypothetical protein